MTEKAFIFLILVIYCKTMLGWASGVLIRSSGLLRVQELP